MQGLVALMRIAVSALLLAVVAGSTPAPAAAACGGGGSDSDQTRLARYVGRHADTIVLGRLVSRDADANYAPDYELLEVYRGEAPASPIENTFDYELGQRGIVEVGSCSNQAVRPGGRFIYAEGDRKRHGPMQVILPYVSGKGWLIDHFVGYVSLDELLVLLGVLPATSTVDALGASDGNLGFGEFMGTILAMTCLVYWGLGKRRRLT